jgi:hypothetical protein
MRHAASVLMVVLAATLSARCAGPKFYHLENGKEIETGIPIYPTRIFLVVSYTGAKDHPVEVTLVRLPDQGKDPIYAREIRGWGGGELSVDFEGGVLKSVGGKSDSQAADTVSALGSLVSAAADVEKALHAQGPEGQPAFRLYEVVMDKSGTTLHEILPSAALPHP